MPEPEREFVLVVPFMRWGRDTNGQEDASIPREARNGEGVQATPDHRQCAVGL